MGSAELVAQLNVALDGLAIEVASDFGSLSSAETLAGALERLARRVESLQVSVVDQVDRTGVFGVDGHHSAIAWSAFTCRTSRTVASRRVRTGRMLRHLTTAAEVFAAGEIGVEQVAVLTKLHGNPRCGHELVDSEDTLVECARRLSFDEFDKTAARWLQVTDQDGAEPKHDTLHENRHLSVNRMPDGGWRLGGSNSAVAGELFNQVLEQFTKTERLADWEAARLIYGDQTTNAHLARTERQRRADALIAMAEQAASTPDGVNKPEPVVNIVMSSDAFENAMAAFTGTPATRPEPSSFLDYRCETVNGGPVSPAEAFRLALQGHVRRVVLGAAETSVSHKARLFTGPLRKLLDIRDGECTWVSCDRPPNQCQGGHLEPWRDDGPTTAANGGLECGPHNRFEDKHNYRTWRDPNGQWHTYRPDGTEVQPAA
jgi:Domain of unknown function (DUF222)